MSKRYEIVEFAARLGALGMRPDTIDRLITLCHRIHKHAENSCNRETSAAEDKRCENAQDEIKTTLDNWGCRLDWSGDPRGWPCIVTPDGCRVAC